jgi:hypothetical protein
LALKLKKFRTQNFRSVEDSGWVDLDDVTALIGINESGKSNLLLSLWKFNPAREGVIDPVPDYQRSLYNDVRRMQDKPIFISTVFEIDGKLAAEIAAKTGLDASNFCEVEIHRDLSSIYTWNFPKCIIARSCRASEIMAVLEAGQTELMPVEPFQKETDLKAQMLTALQAACASLEGDEANLDQLNVCIQHLSVDRESQASSSKIGPIFDDVSAKLGAVTKRLNRKQPTSVEGLWKMVFAHVPKFVYYSNYGNLDSEIYLPHVIANIKRDDLGERETAKARTLRVLFEFVNLSPQEILELGEEAAEEGKTEETIQAEAAKKKEREVLLTSASSQLTKKFRDWWKQGSYRFRFQADGKHFRIWVSDDLRPEEIELEGRSTGLQWFFSFYLVFLVESQDSHSGTILLLDEAGLSLHPLAQRDLSAFFESLSNQIVYTTHSPFLIEPDVLDQVRSVHLNEHGRTTVSADLRINPKIESARKSIYAVHVALGLSVSDTFLNGCLPIVVEGVSDQRYLTAIKNYLIGKGRITPNKDIVFLPAGGTNNKGITAVVSIVCAKDEALPRVFIDSDDAGNKLKQRLESGTYRGFADRIKQVSDYGVFADSEIEDLIPNKELSRVVSRYLPRPSDSEQEFDDFVDDSKPIVPQIEAYAAKHDIDLELGWKVEVATRFKGRLVVGLPIDQGVEDQWNQVFEDFLREEAQ